MPDGYQGPKVYESLKQLEDELDRNWKNRAFERTTMSQPVAVEANGNSTHTEAEIETVVDVPHPEPVSPPAPVARVVERQPPAPPPPEVKPAPELVVQKYNSTKGWGSATPRKQSSSSRLCMRSTTAA